MQAHTLTVTTALIGLSLAAAQPAWAGKAHEHGVMKLDVALEGNTLRVALESPLDSFLGFERAPRTDAERKAAADLLTRLRSPDKGASLFTADAAAQCTLSKAEVRAPVLEAPAAAQAAAKDGHADLDADYTYTCVQPGQLKNLDLALFDAFRRLKRIDVQVAGPQGQAKLTLARPARSIKLAR
jgi:hypothetical protein